MWMLLMTTWITKVFFVSSGTRHAGAKQQESRLGSFNSGAQMGDSLSVRLTQASAWA